MRILLLGDYSNVHATLAEGLRALGHECVLASDGDKWKNYPRDIDLRREFGLRGNSSFLWRLMKALPRFRGYDVVQLINPVFFELKAERLAPFYRYLRRNNGKIVLGAFGMDYYWAYVNTYERPLRYSDFNFADTIRTDYEAELYRHEWIGTPKETLNRMIANDCDGIVAGLYEYWVTYQQFKDKMTFIPFPVKMPSEPLHLSDKTSDKLNLFVGISKNRDAYKGTDIMLSAARAVQEKHPDRLDITVVSAVPFVQYQQMLNASDAILDQLYSYTPAMNSLLAMSKGIINIGGGEPENYEIIGEHDLRPIVNVLPNEENCFQEIERLALQPPEVIARLKRQSVEYVRKHHDYIKVANQYLQFYNTL